MHKHIGKHHIAAYVRSRQHLALGPGLWPIALPASSHSVRALLMLLKYWVRARICKGVIEFS